VWIPVDWVLSSELRTNGLIAAGVGANVVYIQWHDGLHTLVTEGWGWLSACAGALYVLTRWLRRIRRIELPTARSSESSGR
jgi:hypothetical protein